MIAADNYFFDRDGEPTATKIPLVVRVQGEGDLSKVQAAANVALQSFLLGVRLAPLLDQHLKEHTLPNGERMVMRHQFGVTTVEINLSPEGGEPTPFYGGILLQPTYLADESVHFGFKTSVSNNEYVGRVVPAEVASSGETAGLAGRPAVPGTEDTDVTDWLVVQIADTPFTATPVKDGVVSIWRIKEPKFGDLVEISAEGEEEAYLLSTPGSSGFPVAPYQEFYLCGKKVDNIPPLPISAGPVPRTQFARLFTYGLEFESFETANEAEGIVILVLGGQLWAVNTFNRPEAGAATWLKLAEIDPFDTANTNWYGTQLVESLAPGVTTLTCTGSNGAGVCSGFTVTITGVEGGFPILTGELHLMGSGRIPPITAELTLSKSITHDRAYEAFAVGVLYRYDLDENFEPTIPVFATHHRTVDPSVTTMTYSYRLADAVAEQTFDTFRGGMNWVPPRGIRQLSYTTSRTIGAGLFVQTNPGEYPPTFQYHNVQAHYNYQGLFTCTGSALGDYKAEVYYSADTSTGPPSVVTNVVSSGTVTNYGGRSVTLSPNASSQYMAFDNHVNKLAWDWRSTRTGVINSGSSYDSKVDINWVGTFYGGGGPGLVSYGPSTLPLRTVNASCTQLECAWRLIKPDDTEVFAWNDIFALLPSRPASAAAMNWPVDAYVTLPHELLFGAAFSSAGGASNKSYPGYFPTVLAPTANGFSRWEFDGGAYTDAETHASVLHIAHTVDFPAMYPTSPFTLASFKTTYPSSYYALNNDPGGGQFPSATVTVTPPLVDIPAPQGYIGGTQNIVGRKHLIYRDLRTGGYIAQVHGMVQYSTFNWYALHDSIIGNNHGAVPLKDVLAEWKALGSSSSPNDKHVFIDQQQTFAVMLL